MNGQNAVGQGQWRIQMFRLEGARPIIFQKEGAQNHIFRKTPMNFKYFWTYAKGGAGSSTGRGDKKMA